MCRLGILGSCLTLIVAFVLCVSNTEGSVSSAIVKRNTHSREFYNEDYDADANLTEMAFLHRVSAHDFDESVVIGGHNNVKRSESSASVTSVKDDLHKVHRSTRAVDVDLPNKNTVMAEEYTSKIHVFNSDSPRNVPANAPGEEHEDFVPHDHDDDDSFLAHDHQSRNEMPQFEASASAFHKIVQVRELAEEFELGQDQAFGENDYSSRGAEGGGHHSHRLTKRSALSSVRTEKSVLKEKATVDSPLIGRLLAVARQKKEKHYSNENGDELVVDIDRNPHFPSSFCELEKDVGTVCTGLSREIAVQQYYYDPRKNLCIHFTYSGCGGNANRFSSFSECSHACVNSKLKNKRVENERIFPSKWYN